MASYIWWLNRLFMSVGDCFDVQFAVGWYIFIELSISLIKNHPCLNSNSNSILESCVSAFSHHMFLTVSDAIVYWPIYRLSLLSVTHIWTLFDINNLLLTLTLFKYFFSINFFQQMFSSTVQDLNWFAFRFMLALKYS